MQKILFNYALTGTLCVVVSTLPAIGVGSPPEGVAFGPWILAPQFGSSYAADTNLFREQKGDEVSDQVAKLEGGLSAYLPFSNSLLELSYDAAQDQFQESEFERSTTQTFGVDLDLNFKTGDRLTIGDSYRRDFARSEEVDAGGEITFNGEPYSFNRWTVEVARDDPRSQGYVVRIQRQDFTYDGETDIGFFEYRGFDNYFEFRQPVPGNRQWLMRYRQRRFNHYRPNEPDEIGIAFRKEETDYLEWGLRGVVGRGNPYRLLVGYSDFKYKGPEDSEFRGIVGSFLTSMAVGGRTDLEVELIRQPLPSNFDTHYINNGFRSSLERDWLDFEGGVEVRVTLNQYADAIDGLDCDGRRKDTTYQGEVYWGWRLHERYRFEISSYYSQRGSNCERSDFEGVGVEAGFDLGWF